MASGHDPIEVYACGAAPVLGCGISYPIDCFNDEFRAALRTLHRDEAGQAQIRELMLDCVETGFEVAAVDAILDEPMPDEDWRIGETISVEFLQSQKDFIFPWPSTRDARNLDGSPTGADQVGFKKLDDDTTLFAFGETKTSKELTRPPSVLYGRTGLVAQLIDRLPDRKGCKDLIRYLAHRAVRDIETKQLFRGALRSYISDQRLIELVGVMVRPVEPHEDDLRARCNSLGREWSNPRDLELFALYIPPGILNELKSSWNIAPHS